MLFSAFELSLVFYSFVFQRTKKDFRFLFLLLFCFAYHVSYLTHKKSIYGNKNRQSDKHQNDAQYCHRCSHRSNGNFFILFIFFIYFYVYLQFCQCRFYQRKEKKLLETRRFRASIYLHTRHSSRFLQKKNKNSFDVVYLQIY